MKKTLLSLFLAMAVAAGASAAQQTEVDKGDRYDYKYPVFTQENPQAAQRMNRDIQKWSANRVRICAIRICVLSAAIMR